MQRLYFANVSTFSNKDFQTIFLNQSKSVKLTAPKICRMSRTKTGRALVYVANDGYDVALAISLSLKTSNIFPDREFWLKNGPKSKLSGKLEISGKSRVFAKTVNFLFSMCFEHVNTLCVQISLKNINFWGI